mmetsp:Transcript_3550/g.8595  ORF Transcript_3550/g.8595 Transcript_3550/m.8595 type:complete len:224 (-) Transcript_3550:1395-2066(-)
MAELTRTSSTSVSGSYRSATPVASSRTVIGTSAPSATPDACGSTSQGLKLAALVTLQLAARESSPCISRMSVTSRVFTSGLRSVTVTSRSKVKTSLIARGWIHPLKGWYGASASAGLAKVGGKHSHVSPGSGVRRTGEEEHDACGAHTPKSNWAVGSVYESLHSLTAAITEVHDASAASSASSQPGCGVKVMLRNTSCRGPLTSKTEAQLVKRNSVCVISTTA